MLYAASTSFSFAASLQYLLSALTCNFFPWSPPGQMRQREMHMQAENQVRSPGPKLMGSFKFAALHPSKGGGRSQHLSGALSEANFLTQQGPPQTGLI